MEGGEKMSVMTLDQALNNAFDIKLAEDKNVVLYGEDVGLEGGVFRVTEGLQKKYGTERVFDTPLAESAIVGTALGMAVSGLRPVVELQFDGFRIRHLIRSSHMFHACTTVPEESTMCRW